MNYSPVNKNHHLYTYSSVSGSLMSNFNLPVGEWLDIVFVFDKEMGEARFHVNNSFSVVPLGFFSYRGMSRAYLGFEGISKGEVIVDEYAIFERVLTEEEISSL